MLNISKLHYDQFQFIKAIILGKIQKCLIYNCEKEDNNSNKGDRQAERPEEGGVTPVIPKEFLNMEWSLSIN